MILITRDFWGPWLQIWSPILKILNGTGDPLIFWSCAIYPKSSKIYLKIQKNVMQNIKTIYKGLGTSL